MHEEGEAEVDEARQLSAHRAGTAGVLLLDLAAYEAGNVLRRALRRPAVVVSERLDFLRRRSPGARSSPLWGEAGSQSRAAYWYQKCSMRYRRRVAVNLRLSKAAADALRRVAESTGRSQQQLLREAVDRYLGLDAPGSDRERARTAGLVRPGTPFRDVGPTVRLPHGGTTRELLDPDADPR